MCLDLRLQTRLQVAAGSLLHRHLIESRRSGFLPFAGMDAILVRQLPAIVLRLLGQQLAVGVVLPAPSRATRNGCTEQQRRQCNPDHCSTSSARL